MKFVKGPMVSASKSRLLLCLHFLRGADPFFIFIPCQMKAGLTRDARETFHRVVIDL